MDKIEVYFDKNWKDFIGRVEAMCIPTCGYIISKDYIVKNNIYPVRINKIGKQLLDFSEAKDLEEKIGELILKNGNIVQIIKRFMGTYLISFPVNEDWVENPGEDKIINRFRKYTSKGKFIPAIMVYANPETIERSIKQLQEIDNWYQFNSILFPNIKTIEDDSYNHDSFIRILSKYDIAKKCIITVDDMDL